MNYLKILTFSTAIILFIYPYDSKSQTISLSSLVNEQIRLNSLLSDSLTFSTVNLPVTNYAYRKHINSDQNQEQWWNRSLTGTKFNPVSNIYFGLYPSTFQNTTNSRFPHGANNGAAWYGRGNNTEFWGGFYATSPYLTISFYPHIIHQDNSDFLHPRFISRRSGEIRYLYEGVGNALDAPFRFGSDSFTTFDWGNSSIRLHYKQIETGISTEPLWWGPAIQYPLIMSNNAPGIPHIFLATREPIKIPYLGSIQFRWISGYPEESKFFDGVASGESRFTTAANFAYTPPFFKNLTVGLTRVYHVYEEDGFDISNLTLIFDPVRRSSLVSRQGEDDVRQQRNQTASVYFHLLMPEANAEIYAEFFREDHSYDFRDLFVQPNHNSAYAFGLQKISYVPLVDFIKTNIEFTNLTTSQLQQVRPQAYFYTHSRIRHGHTNRGQIMGAAIGPGSNSQYFGMDAYRSKYKLGFFVQRVVDNDNFHFREGSASLSSTEFGDYFRHRVDLNLGLNFLYGPGPVYLNSSLVWTKALNYGRFDYGEFEGINISNYEPNDRTNIQFQIGITYVL